MIDSEQGAAPREPLGAAEAIRLLYPQQGEAVYRTIYGIVLDAGQAEDLTRETFVRAYREWETSEPSDPRTWLLGIATSLAIPSMGTRRPRWPVAPWRARRDRNGAGHIEEALPDQDPVARLMRPLHPEERALVILHYCQQLPSAVIAEEFGLRYARVPSRVNRAMQVLRTRAHGVGMSPGATDVAITGALMQALTGAPISLPPVETILSVPDRPAPVSILPLPPPGLIFRSSRGSEKSLSRYLPYLVAVTVGALLIGVVVAGLNLYAASQEAPASARSLTTPPPRTFQGGAGSSTTPPTVLPTPVPPPPTPVATPPPATPVPAAPAPPAP
ncbi:MAG: sigma-70 family RNA polymerase sigma factor, partial [Candidatus Dormibacteraeota bacterium]|nr:sigma-70 family RNA polymerase sigma factor [Candidatus Dormibacteraeota bacterium]